MALLLDTSAAVDLIDQVAVAHRRAEEADALFLSVISLVELEAGVQRSGRVDPLFRARLDALLERVELVAFTHREAAAYGRIIEARGFSRRLVVDRMIAATALVQGIALATSNSRDFRNIPGLEIQDWAA